MTLGNVCCYRSGHCYHPECDANPRSEPEPSIEDYCHPHPFYGWEWSLADVPDDVLPELGRCYCGLVRYPWHPWPDLLGEAMRVACAGLLNRVANSSSEVAV